MNNLRSAELVDVSGNGPTVTIADPLVDCQGLPAVTFEVVIQSFTPGTAKFWLRGGIDPTNIVLDIPPDRVVPFTNMQLAANGYQVEDMSLGGVLRAMVTYVNPPPFVEMHAEATGAPARTFVRAYTPYR
jgi:hypothetical protein